MDSASHRKGKSDAASLALFLRAFAKADARATAVFFNEANPSSLQRFLHFYASFI
jgi:hypothetical protein